VDATPSDREHLFLEVVFMRSGRRYGISSAQKTEIWRRWKAGESLHEIGRGFGKDHGSIHFLLSQHGGIAPAVRRRSERTLTLAEREELSRLDKVALQLNQRPRKTFGFEAPASKLQASVAATH
jgi:hypothetical protein